MAGTTGMADGRTAEWGRILAGDESVIRASYAALAAQPVDQVLETGPRDDDPMQTTLAKPVSVVGPGTFFKRADRPLIFEPCAESGWWLDRMDLPGELPIPVGVGSVWTTVRNIVLRSGSPRNYLRMVEHIVALRVGLGIDNVRIRITAGDPPLFDRSSMPLVEALDAVGRVATATPAVYYTVKAPVTMGGPYGSFLTFLPAENGSRELQVDCALDFPNAIGRQRIRFNLTRAMFRHGAQARTNSNLGMLLYVKTLGLLFADTRNMGYNLRNILIAGRWRYANRPLLFHNGKALEAAWHRATLDLLAAVALIDKGRLAGRIVSYKAGHALDVDMVKRLYQDDLLTPLA